MASWEKSGSEHPAIDHVTCGEMSSQGQAAASSQGSVTSVTGPACDIQRCGCSSWGGGQESSSLFFKERPYLRILPRAVSSLHLEKGEDVSDADHRTNMTGPASEWY